MKYVEIKSLFRESEKYDGQKISVRGWVRTNRGSNKFGFKMCIRDRVSP